MAWSWPSAARRGGVGRDGSFNAGSLSLESPCALVWARRDGTVERYSGAELTTLARRTAGALRSIGVRAGDRVAGLLGRRPEGFTVPLALWQLGAIFVPLFSGFRSEAIRTRLEDSGTTIVVTDVDNRASLGEAEAGLGPLTVVVVDGRGSDGDLSLSPLLERATADAGLAATSSRDPAAIMYTSGTSGPPKGCVIPHHGVLALWPYVEHCLELSPGDVLFSTADIGWSFGLYTTGLSPLSLGGTRLLYEGAFEPAGWWSAIRSLGVTHLASAPTGFRQLAHAGESHVESGIGALRSLTSAGETLNPEAIQWFEDRLGVTICDSYGLTELGMVITNRGRPGSPPPAPGSMGMPLPGFEVVLASDEGEPDNRL